MTSRKNDDEIAFRNAYKHARAGASGRSIMKNAPADVSHTYL